MAIDIGLARTHIEKTTLTLEEKNNRVRNLQPFIVWQIPDQITEFLRYNAAW